MIIHDDIFKWKGWGGKLKLAGGRCRLKILNIAKDNRTGVAYLKPFVVIASDLPGDAATLKKVTVRSCASHIATCVAREFNIDPSRMVFVEYYPQKTYGEDNEHVISERFDTVDFEWHGDMALFPSWRPVKPPLLDTLKEILAS